MISSQDFRNKYEKFYDNMRLYLWPYDTLEQLGQVEVDIYSAFIDRDKLSSDFYRLSSSLKDVLEEDKEFNKAYKDLQKVIDAEDRDSYHYIQRVEEINPEKDKVLRVPKEDDEEDEEGDLII